MKRNRTRALRVSDPHRKLNGSVAFMAHLQQRHISVALSALSHKCVAGEVNYYIICLLSVRHSIE